MERGKRREREILYSLLLQQQLQLHLIRRHQRYFCNRSPLTLCVCPSLIYSPDCSAGGGGRQAGYGLLKREEERRSESWRRADRSRLLPSLPAAEESRGGERGRAPGPVAAALLTRQPRNSPGRAEPPPAPRSRPARRGAACRTSQRPDAIFKTASCLILIPPPPTSALLSSSLTQPVCHQSACMYVFICIYKCRSFRRWL